MIKSNKADATEILARAMRVIGASPERASMMKEMGFEQQFEIDQWEMREPLVVVNFADRDGGWVWMAGD